MAETKDSRGIEMAQATSHQQDDIEDIKPAAGKIKEVQGDSHFYETVTAAPLDPWSRTSVQLYLILLVAALNATTSGFDGVSLIHPERGKRLAELASSRFSVPSMPCTNIRNISTTLSSDQARECEFGNSVWLNAGGHTLKSCHLTSATASS